MNHADLRRFARLALGLALCVAPRCPRTPTKSRSSKSSPWLARAPRPCASPGSTSRPTGSQKVDKVQIGREMVVAEKSGPWMRVYANTDIEEQHSDKDTPMVGEDEDTAAHLRLDARPRASWKKPCPTATRS